MTKLFALTLSVSILALSACSDQQMGGYKFSNGYPSEATVQKAYDESDLNRAIQAYKFFYPTVAFAYGYDVLPSVGVYPNKSAALMRGTPKQLAFTANSDTPYALVPIDLSAGPFVVEMPAGPIMGAVDDLNQQWVLDYGLPGPDAGKGGKHLVIPPNYKGKIPEGYFKGTASTNRVMFILRALPIGGDMEKANALMKSVKIYPLNDKSKVINKWVDLTDKAVDFTPVSFETSLKYWEELQKFIDREPAYEAYRMSYGDLAALGIAKGQKFQPDARMKAILEKAAVIANGQMRVQSFADRRPDRIVWKDRQWEWVTLRPENGYFDTPFYRDLEAREKWFYQAIMESPAMFQRKAGQGSLYWLAAKDSQSVYLDGSKTYKLTVPLPVPNKLFWSVTVYDTETRSEIQTDQGKAALRSLIELKDAKGKSVDLYFGPKAPAGKNKVWIKTLPGKGWFTYFRIYGPEASAFDGKWKPGDLEEVK